jgi:hypothetical protein
MQTDTTEQIARDILADIRHRENATARRSDATIDSAFGLDFETLIQDEDEDGKAIMRSIMHSLAAR